MIQGNRPIDHFISALIEWDELRGDFERAHDLNSIVIILNIQLGKINTVHDVENINLENSLSDLKSRVIELNDNLGVNEFLIIRGLISTLTDYFRNGYKSIFENLRLKEKFESEQGYCPDFLEKFTKPSYKIAMETDEINWDIIVSKRLNKYFLSDLEDSILLRKIETEN